MRTALNFAIIAVIALAVAVLPGGGNAAAGVGAAISVAFLVAIGFMVWRLYREKRMTLWSMSTQHRAMLYGGLGVIVLTLSATSRLWQTGLGLIVWLALLGGGAFTIFTAWVESRRYRI
jgi:hypothetical protein